MVRIRRSHRRGRGSIPRLGIPFSITVHFVSFLVVSFTFQKIQLFKVSNFLKKIICDNCMFNTNLIRGILHYRNKQE